MFSQCPLALDNLKYIEKLNVSSVTSFLTSAARPFSENMARGRNSHYLMADERKGAHQEDKKEQEANHTNVAPVSVWEQGSQISIMGGPSLHSPLGAALQLLGNHYLC